MTAISRVTTLQARHPIDNSFSPTSSASSSNFPSASHASREGGSNAVSSHRDGFGSRVASRSSAKSASLPQDPFRASFEDWVDSQEGEDGEKEEQDNIGPGDTGGVGLNDGRMHGGVVGLHPSTTAVDNSRAAQSTQRPNSSQQTHLSAAVLAHGETPRASADVDRTEEDTPEAKLYERPTIGRAMEDGAQQPSGEKRRDKYKRHLLGKSRSSKSNDTELKSSSSNNKSNGRSRVSLFSPPTTPRATGKQHPLSQSASPSTNHISNSPRSDYDKPLPVPPVDNSFPSDGNDDDDDDNSNSDHCEQSPAPDLASPFTSPLEDEQEMQHEPNQLYERSKTEYFIGSKTVLPSGLGKSRTQSLTHKTNGSHPATLRSRGHSSISEKESSQPPTASEHSSMEFFKSSETALSERGSRGKLLPGSPGSSSPKRPPPPRPPPRRGHSLNTVN